MPLSENSSGNISFRHFIEATSDIMIILDKSGRTIFLNKRWEEILGYPIKDSVNKDYLEFIHPDDVSKTKDVLQNYLKLCSSDVFYNRCRTNLDDYKWIQWTFSHDKETEQLYCAGRDVTVERRLNANLEILEDVTGVGVWEIDPCNEKIYWSNKIHEIHETDPAIFFPDLETAVNFYTPEAIPILKVNLERMALGEKCNFELPFITANGRRIWVEANLMAELRDGVVIRQYGTFQDITRIREERIANEKLKGRVELAMKASNIGVWELDVADNHLTWDDQMFEIFDVDKKTFKHGFQDWEKTVLPEDLEEAKLEFAKALHTGGIFTYQFRIKTRSGEIRYISAIGKVTNDIQSNTTFVTGINWDVTEQEKSRQSLLDAKEQAETADIAKSTFLASMSHEIRTPLNGIFGALQILQRSEKTDYQDKIISTALNATLGLTRIINDILDFSKIQANKLELEYIPVDIESLAKDVLDEQSLMTDQTAIETSINASNEAQGYWSADPLRLKQILNNLISNAFKFTRKGTIEVCLAVTNNNFTITVSDTGIGMNDSELKNLFTPFTQADGSISRKFGGTGLGLTITQNLVALFKGKISVKSEPSAGTTFCVKIPIKKLKNANILPVKESPNPIPDLTGKLIFVAEDNDINQTIISEMLKPTSAKFFLFKDGQGLLDGVARKRPDLILCDIQMPVLDGTEACKEIRRTDKSTPIIAVTANVMTSDMQTYIKCGFDSILGKPLMQDELYTLLNKYLFLRANGEQADKSD